MKEINTVCIIGGGNIGHALIASLNVDRISLLTSRPNEFSNEILCFNERENGKIIKTGKLFKVSDNPSDVIPNADMILFTVPSNAIKPFIKNIKDLISPNCIIGFIPGTGGKEFLSSEYFGKKHTVFGTQRVPFSARIMEYGKKVFVPKDRKELRVGYIPRNKTEEAASISSILNIPVVLLDNYLNVTLTPSNQLVHTSRIYSILQDYRIGTYLNSEISFYKKWDNNTSEIMLNCDDELQQLCGRLENISFYGIAFTKEHYETTNIAGKNEYEKLTNKITTLPYSEDSFPLKKIDNRKYVPDFDSRYFTEDFPSLCIIKSFCRICGIKTPTIDSILKWYSKILNKEYFVENTFTGKDLKKLSIPQNYGIETIEDIYAFYS